MNHLSELTIWSFLEGELQGDELEAAEDHLAGCDACCALLAGLAELGAEIPELMALEAPTTGFADRVMGEITSAKETPPVPDNVIPLRPRRRSPRYEAFTRFVTAAAVTGFMIFGSMQVQSVPVLDEIGNTVTQTSFAVSDGTVHLFSQIHTLLDVVSSKMTE